MKMMVRLAARLACLLLPILLGAAPAVAKDSYQTVNGLNYFVRDSGGNGDPVLMLHGQPDDCTVWDAQVAALSKAGYRVLCPDLVGYGKTDKPEALDRYRTASVAADLDKMLDQLGIRQPVHVVAHDWGVAVANDLYYGFPGRVRSLALFAVGHPAEYGKESLTFENSRWNWFILLQGHPGAAELYRANNGAFMREASLRSHPRREAVIARLLQPGGVEAMLRWDQANPVINFYIAANNGELQTLPKYAVPVLGIAATGDEYLWPSQMKNTRNWVSGRFEYMEIKGGTHWMMIDHVAEVSARLVAWLASQPPLAAGKDTK